MKIEIFYLDVSLAKTLGSKSLKVTGIRIAVANKCLNVFDHFAGLTLKGVKTGILVVNALVMRIIRTFTIAIWLSYSFQMFLLLVNKEVN